MTPETLALALKAQMTAIREIAECVADNMEVLAGAVPDTATEEQVQWAIEHYTRARQLREFVAVNDPAEPTILHPEGETPTIDSP